VAALKWAGVVWAAVVWAALKWAGVVWAGVVWAAAGRKAGVGVVWAAVVGSCDFATGGGQCWASAGFGRMSVPGQLWEVRRSAWSPQHGGPMVKALDALDGVVGFDDLAVDPARQVVGAVGFLA